MPVELAGFPVLPASGVDGVGVPAVSGGGVGVPVLIESGVDGGGAAWWSVPFPPWLVGAAGLGFVPGAGLVLVPGLVFVPGWVVEPELGLLP
ncbi:hypothetical protein ACFORO_12905 [Amycolatopsis halotolerans]|uniref:Uncharacterized protein n=1 Tax=Amycolatopsis halotolerans TaxID=330083 RepID=A0ABV7QFR4_9PSEU